MTGTTPRDWTPRLSRHFAALRDRRAEDGTTRPVFALEHGLGESERQDLAEALRAEIAHRAPSDLHWLLWVVYSSELGYGYSGDEYWRTFERETPGWILHGDRHWIRNCFKKFQREYGGAVPSGAWAKHFTIICWPITHALLPKDLQQQFAEVLFQLRNSFSGELLESPLQLGERIALHSWNASSRFLNLAQEKLFLGQIAAALLLEDHAGSGELIHPATLERIRSDLDCERRSRDWIRRARRFAKDRVKVRGLGVTTGSLPRADQAKREVQALGIEPRVVLRPMDLERCAWKVSLEIPNLSHLLVGYPEAKTALTSSRCVVAGASGRPLARGRCLFDEQCVILVRWPSDDEVLLQFEHSHEHLDYLLRTDCLLRPGPTWLFRIASDGLANEVRGMRVRPGGRYVVVSTKGPFPPSAQVQPVDLQCKGVHGALLDLPAIVSPTWEHTIRVLGLHQSRSIEVWPAGLAAAAWDGDGHAEWLPYERPCLAIRADLPLEGLSVLRGSESGPPIELGSVEPGEPIFLELEPLLAGHHRLRFTARPAPSAGDEVFGDLDVMIRVREVRTRPQGIGSSGLLDVQLEPLTPSLEQLWEGSGELTILGPVGRQVSCRVALFNDQGDSAIVAKQLPQMKLPVSNDTWREIFEKYFCKSNAAKEAYDVARSCSIEFRADELGAFSVECKREFVPLRWSVHGRRGQDYIVRLFDDSGLDDQATVTHFPFETPTDENDMGYCSEYAAPSSGGMYVARLPHTNAAVLVPPEIRELSNLRCNPTISSTTRSVESIQHLLSLARVWGQAKLPGDLAVALRRRDVLYRFVSHIFLLVCGENWERAESVALGGRSGLTGLTAAISQRRNETGVGVALELESVNLAGKSCHERVERLASITTSFHLLPSPGSAGRLDARWISEFALRVASDPSSVEEWAGEELRAGLAVLLESTTLARAARYLVLSVAQHFDSRSGASLLYAGWKWE